MRLFAAKPTIVFLSALVGSSACNAEFRFADHGDSAGISGDDADAGGSDAGGRCKSDPDCRLPNLHCFEGVCVPCLQDSHCVAPLSRCDLAAHRCVECGLGTDCLPTESCEPLSRTCVRRCGTGNPCPVDFGRCDVARGFCISCTKSGECSAASEQL